MGSVRGSNACVGVLRAAISSAAARLLPPPICVPYSLNSLIFTVPSPVCVSMRWPSVSTAMRSPLMTSSRAPRAEVTDSRPRSLATMNTLLAAVALGTSLSMKNTREPPADSWIYRLWLV